MAGATSPIIGGVAASREPRLTRIITGNTDANEHMIAINAELGFGVLDQWPSWEIDVDQLLT